MKMRVLYIGGFCMPDKNAAAQRVLGVGKLLRQCSCDVRFCGLEHDISEPKYGTIEGFSFINYPYPMTSSNWLKYLTGHDSSIKEIEKYNPDIVILYNHPALAIERITRYCHKHSIKVIGDVTEWYVPSGNPIFKVIKGYDTNRRMRKSHLKLDGLICISNYLADYYEKDGMPVFKVPPLVDIEQAKWNQSFEEDPDKIRMVYAGSPGFSKDRLDLIIKALDDILSHEHSTVVLDVIGITAEQYKTTWRDDKEYPFVTFQGRIPHMDVIKFLLAADFQIFLRPDILSNRAGFPTKFVETITSRTLPITNLSSNLSDFLQDEENGFIIKSLDSFDIKHSLLKALSLSKDKIALKKGSMDTGIFDFRNYTELCKAFLSAI